MLTARPPQPTCGPTQSDHCCTVSSGGRLMQREMVLFTAGSSREAFSSTTCCWLRSAKLQDPVESQKA